MPSGGGESGRDSAVSLPTLSSSFPVASGLVSAGEVMVAPSGLHRKYPSTLISALWQRVLRTSSSRGSRPGQGSASDELCVDFAAVVLAARAGPFPRSVQACPVPSRVVVRLIEKIEELHEGVPGQSLVHGPILEADRHGVMTRARVWGERRMNAQSSHSAGARGCRIASVPPSAYTTEPTIRLLASDNRKPISAAISSGRPARPIAVG